MKLQGVPFLTVSEFIRAKMKSWTMYAVITSSILTFSLTKHTPSRRLERDAHDIVYVLTHFWNRVDINRIPEQEMAYFVSRYKAAAPAWVEIKRKYGM
jgi:hypothetical protein